MALQSTNDLKRRRKKLHRYLARYGKWRKTVYRLRITNPAQFEKFVANYSNNESPREWLLKREIKAQECKEELRRIKTELNKSNYVQPIAITLAVVSIILLIGLLSANVPTGFAVSAKNTAGEIYIEVSADTNIVTERLAFDKDYLPASCSDLEISIDNENIAFSIVSEKHNENGCEEVYVTFDNKYYNIKQVIYEVKVI